MTVSSSAEAASCHQCKSRRLLSELHYCSNMPAPRRQCRKKFCDGCLDKFYNGASPEAGKEDKWQCPSCRGFCCCAACVRRLNPESRPVRRRSYDEPMEVSHLNIIASSPEALIDQGARALLYSVSQHQQVQKKVVQYASMQGVSEQQRVGAIVQLLSQVAFPDAWSHSKQQQNFPTTAFESSMHHQGA